MWTLHPNGMWTRDTATHKARVYEVVPGLYRNSVTARATMLTSTDDINYPAASQARAAADALMARADFAGLTWGNGDPITPAEAVAFAETGLTPAEVADWMRKGWAPEDAARYARLGLTADEAIDELTIECTGGSSAGWAAAGYGRRAAVRHIDAGRKTPAEAVTYDEHVIALSL